MNVYTYTQADIAIGWSKVQHDMRSHLGTALIGIALELPASEASLTGKPSDRTLLTMTLCGDARY